MLLFSVLREVQSVVTPVVRHLVSVACGHEMSELPRDVATQTRREFTVGSPSEVSDSVGAVSDDEQRESEEMNLDVAEDVVGPSGSVAVAGETGASILDSSVPSSSAVGSRPVRAGKLNSFIDHVIHCFLSFQFFLDYSSDYLGFVFDLFFRFFSIFRFQRFYRFYIVGVFFS